MLGIREAIDAIRQMLVLEERVSTLANEVFETAESVDKRLQKIETEQRDQRDRIAWIEGAIDVLRQQPNKP